MYYRKIPVIIEAEQFTDENKNRCYNFITNSNKSADFDEAGNPILKIQTLEGVMTANIGDWIIKGVKGEFYPRKDDIFKQTYEPYEPYEPSSADIIIGNHVVHARANVLD